MKGDLEKIIALMKYNGEDINSLSEKGYDFFEILSAANWIHFSEDIHTESLRYYSHEEFEKLPDNIRDRINEIIYKDGISALRKENFIDLLTGFTEMKSDLEEEEFENIVDVIFHDKVV